MTRLRRFIRWLRSPGSPSDYPEADIATNRWMTTIFHIFATVVFIGGVFITKPPVSAAEISVLLSGALFLWVVGDMMSIQALRWQVEELEKEQGLWFGGGLGQATLECPECGRRVPVTKMVDADEDYPYEHTCFGCYYGSMDPSWETVERVLEDRGESE